MVLAVRAAKYWLIPWSCWWVGGIEVQQQLAANESFACDTDFIIAVHRRQL